MNKEDELKKIIDKLTIESQKAAKILKYYQAYPTKSVKTQHKRFLKTLALGWNIINLTNEYRTLKSYKIDGIITDGREIIIARPTPKVEQLLRSSNEQAR